MYKYSAELLNTEPENTKYVDQFNNSNDLIKNWYHIHYNTSPITVEQKRISKLNHIYDSGKLPLSGHGLEMAFGFGESIYVLLNWYKNITMDAFDFNPLLSKIIPFIKDLYDQKINDMWIGDSQKISKPDNYYDFINSCSFFEHLPEEVYWNTIKETIRVLKPGKYLGCYLDKGKNYGEHIRCVPIEQTKKELQSIGFLCINDYIYQKPK